MTAPEGRETAGRAVELSDIERKLDWKRDSQDYSWFAWDYLGYFYRVSKVSTPRDELLFACAWTETNGLRLSPSLSSTLEHAKSRMDNIAAFSTGEVK